MPIEQREMGMVNRTTTFFIVWVLAPFPKVDLFDLCRRGNAVAVQVEMRDKEFAQLLCYLRVCVDNISAFGLNPRLYSVVQRRSEEVSVAAARVDDPGEAPFELFPSSGVPWRVTSRPVAMQRTPCSGAAGWREYPLNERPVRDAEAVSHARYSIFVVRIQYLWPLRHRKPRGVDLATFDGRAEATAVQRERVPGRNARQVYDRREDIKQLDWRIYAPGPRPRHRNDQRNVGVLRQRRTLPPAPEVTELPTVVAMHDDGGSLTQTKRRQMVHHAPKLRICKRYGGGIRRSEVSGHRGLP